MTALSFVWVHPYSQNSRCDTYKQSFKQFGQYMGKFLVDLHDPNYVNTLYNIEKHEREPLIRRGAGAKTLYRSFM